MKSNEEMIRLLTNCMGMMDFGRATRLCAMAVHAAEHGAKDGAFCEFGCYQGKTAALLSAATGRRFHLFDSFDGLPARAEQDSNAADVFQQGVFKASPEQVEQTFVDAGVEFPFITPGLFGDLKPDRAPDNIAFCHIDGDFYQSILDALALVTPKMAPGGLIVVDDFNNPELPGATAAVVDFLAKNHAGCHMTAYPYQALICVRFELKNKIAELVGESKTVKYDHASE